MRQVSTNTDFNVCYAANNRESSLGVTFDIWNTSGTVLGANIPALEIGSKGVYTINSISPSDSTYLLIKATDGDFPSSFVIQVGNPATKELFYSDDDFTIGLTIAYELYDSLGNIQQSGNLTEVAGGFYKVDVTSLTGPHYFKVFPETELTEL